MVFQGVFQWPQGKIGPAPFTVPSCSTYPTDLRHTTLISATYRTILYNLYKINPPHLHTERVATKILTINKK